MRVIDVQQLVHSFTHGQALLGCIDPQTGAVALECALIHVEALHCMQAANGNSLIVS
jgi:hypothetical protein